MSISNCDSDGTWPRWVSAASRSRSSERAIAFNTAGSLQPRICRRMDSQSAR